ncbi:hypothetical protein Q8A67_024729 [Cirrhinus molitorella]|uniref:Uncharacterized protein n=1 Tax=Cirrhinus molitorella TaxID=172907 RepID=A0AA88NZ11_9TELE|nr:hypothetical protein Q8A67_024729 [Cirrhinus molitorella]
MFPGSWFLIPPSRQRRPQTLSGSPSSKLPAAAAGSAVGRGRGRDAGLAFTEPGARSISAPQIDEPSDADLLYMSATLEPRHIWSLLEREREREAGLFQYWQGRLQTQ